MCAMQGNTNFSLSFNTNYLVNPNNLLTHTHTHTQYQYHTNLDILDFCLCTRERDYARNSYRQRPFFACFVYFFYRRWCKPNGTPLGPLSAITNMFGKPPNVSLNDG